MSIDDEGIEHCSHERRKINKVRVRIQKRYRMNVWLQVYGKASPFAIRIRHPHALKDAVRSAATELTETYSTHGVRKFQFTFPMEATDWLKTGIPSEEERYVGLGLKAARRLVKGKAENEWGAKKQLVEQSIISATDAALFVYKHTQLDVVAVKTKIFDMEILGVTGQVALFELIVARKDTHAMAKISSPAIRNEFPHLSIWPMNTTQSSKQRGGTTQTKAPFMLTGQDVWKVKGQLSVQARADATTVEEE
jgi:hypothetical protein